MPSICLFSSYSDSENIAEYIRIYLNELLRNFDKIIFITNERSLQADAVDWLASKKIECMFVANEGFDFGMWYKALKRYDLSEYERVGLINDSSVLYKPLDEFFNWINSNNYDYCGLISSSIHAYHIQSFFVVMNKRAFSLVREFFMKNGIINKYWNVIQVYEIGLSQLLLQHGLKLGAYYENITLNAITNPSFSLLPQLIKEGLPMIKKKVLFRKYRPGEHWGLMLMDFDIDERKYIKLIKNANNNNLLIDLSQTVNDNDVRPDRLFLFSFSIGREVAKRLRRYWIARKFYFGLVKIKRLLIGRL